MKKQFTVSLAILLFLSTQSMPELNAVQPTTMNAIDSDGFPRDLPIPGRNCGQEGSKASTWGIPLACKKFNGNKIWARTDGKNTGLSPTGFACPAKNHWLRIDQYKYPCVKKNSKLVWGKGTYLDAGIIYKQIPGIPRQPAIYSITQQQREKDPRTGKVIPEQVITYVDALNSIEKEIAKICTTIDEKSNYCGISAAKTKQIDFNQSKNYLINNGFKISYWPTNINSGELEIGIWIRSDGEDITGSPAGAPCAYEEINGANDEKVKSIQEMPYLRYQEKIYTCITSDKGRVFDQGIQVSAYKLDPSLANIKNGYWVRVFKDYTSSIEKSGYNSYINGIAGTLCRPWWGEKELSIFGVPMTCVVFDPKEIPQRSQMTELWDLNSDAIYCVIDKSLIKASKSTPSALREIVLVTESCQRMIAEKRLV